MMGGAALEPDGRVAGAGAAPGPDFMQDARTVNASKPIVKCLIGKNRHGPGAHSFKRTGVPQWVQRNQRNKRM